MTLEKKHFLFLCTGNTCRSPMAAALAEQAFPGVSCTSAGLAAQVGQPAAANSIAVMAEVGLDVSQHRSAALTPALLAQADVVLTMTTAQKEWLLQWAPQVADKVFSLAEYAGVPGEIGDPYGGDLECYRQCRDSIQFCIDRILTK